MPSFLEILPEKLNRLIGNANAPVIIDVRLIHGFSLAFCISELEAFSPSCIWAAV